jgi:hypothetical protein
MRTRPPTLRGERSGAPPPPAPLSVAEERAERVRFSLPLLLLAGASLVSSFVLYSDAFGGHATRVPLWVLALSVGVIASVGGTASLLVGDFSGAEWRAEAEASDEFVVVDRARWLEIQTALAIGYRTPEGPADPSPVASDEPPAPEWAEPASPIAVGAEDGANAPRPVGPPAPMAVSHGIESLATEVERMVADLDAAAGGPVVPAPSPPRPSLTPRATPAAGSPASPRPSSPSPSRPGPIPDGPAIGAGPAPVGPKPSVRPVALPAPRSAPRPAPRTPAASPPPPVSEEAMSGEYRTLLTELERRASGPLGDTSRSRPVARAAPPGERCVGCDAKLPPSDRSSVCEACHCPMCASCRDRSAREGYSGLCALCSILEESARRDSSRDQGRS